MLEKLRSWSKAAKRDILTIYLAMRDPRVPWLVKAMAVVVTAYALSPIDLIPDFVPVVGYLDDLVLVPLGVLLVMYMIPNPVKDELRQQADSRLAEKLPKSNIAATVIIVLWVLIGCATVALLFSIT